MIGLCLGVMIIYITQTAFGFHWAESALAAIFVSYVVDAVFAGKK